MRNVLLCLVGGLALSVSAESRDTTAANRVIEIEVKSSPRHSETAADRVVDAVVVAPDGRSLRLPAFSEGGDRWCFRYASAQVGRHVWRLECPGASDATLARAHGVINVGEYRGANPLYRHGPLRVAPDQRHFEHADGTPFFWLGDTWWKGLCDRLPWPGFQELTRDRVDKGFTVVQIVAGPYPDEPLFDPRWANEGGMPYDADFTRANPAYFGYADRRIQHLVEAGLTPALVGSWGMHLPAIGVEKMKRHWRHLIARYAAYPVVWVVAGEAVDVEKWSEITRYVREVDPFGRLVTLHPPINSARKHVGDRAVLDFDMISTGHGGWDVATRTVAEVDSSYALTPPRPVLVGEVGYEGHMLTHGADFQRYQFWTSLLRGTAGHTYGAGGVWQMNSATVRGSEYEFTPWFEAMHLAGSRQVGLGKALLERYPWWRFEPHPDWIEPRGFCAGIPGEVRVAYVPYRAYDWTAPTVRQLDPNTTYEAYYWDPASGRSFGLGSLLRPIREQSLCTDDFEAHDRTAWRDYGTPSRSEQGRLVGGKGLLTVHEQVSGADVLAEVEATSGAEAGLVLRFHDPDHYLVALYSPSLKAAFLHDRQRGEWGPPLGRVAAPNLGPRIRLTAAAVGDAAALVVSDGEKTYATATVKVGNLTAGRGGVWLFQVGEEQRFDNFALSRVRVDLPRLHSRHTPLVLRANPYVGLPAVSLPACSLLLSDAYTPPRLPAPQDWVFVLEQLKP